MDMLLVGINAKFVHSNLAIRYMKTYCEKLGYDIEIEEYTINQRVDVILSEIMKKKPRAIGFSCYLWNIEFVAKLCSSIKKIDENCWIFLGGPEVSYCSEKWIETLRVDAIIKGEGEKTVLELLKYLKGEPIRLEQIEGLVYRQDDKIIANKKREPMDLSEIPFPYNEKSIQELASRIIYYESSRGCPFGCRYCLSSIEKGVRFRDIELVKTELDFFLKLKVKQVKFVDRTFNCNKKHTMAIWEHLIENDNGITNFHFEITAELITEEMLALLKNARIGLFQFEIGVQSTNIETLKEINRNMSFEELADRVNRIKTLKNIHLHLDLIAGLPREDYVSFEKSFNDVYSLKPEQLQLGFLKVLKGSEIFESSSSLGIVYREYAPYEVLKTGDISYSELEKLKIVEEMVELYFNSGNYANTIGYLESQFEKPFKLFEGIAEYWLEGGLHTVSHSKSKIAEILRDFSIIKTNADKELLENLILFDWCLAEKPRKYPAWVKDGYAYKEQINNFYKDEDNIKGYLANLEAFHTKQISRMVHIEVFEYDLHSLKISKNSSIKKEKTAILFNYFENEGLEKTKIYKLDNFWRN